MGTYFSKEVAQMQNRYTKRYSAQPVIRKTQTETAAGDHRLPAGMAMIQKTRDNECWQRYGERGHLYIVDGEANRSSRVEKSVRLLKE